MVYCDLAWQSFLGRQLLAGRSLYSDIAVGEMHPPLYTWLAAGFAAAGRALGVSTSRLFLVWTAVATCAAVVVAWRLFGGGLLVAVAFAFAGVAAHGYYFAGGEQLAVAFALPYVAMTARLANDENDIGRKQRLAISALAAFGLAMKPQFVLLWLGAELYLASQRGWSTLFRAECLLMPVIWAAYFILTYRLTPHYFDALIWAVPLYQEFGRAPLDRIVTSWRTALAGSALLMFLLRKPEGARHHLVVLLLVGTAAMWVATVSQLKGWPTHWLPVEALSGAALILCLPRRYEAFGAPFIALFALIWMNLGLAAQNAATSRDPSNFPATVEIVHRWAPNGPVLALSGELAIGFPLINVTGAEWTSPFACFWMLPGLHPFYRANPSGFHYHSPTDWSPAERLVYDNLWRGITERPPRIIFLERDRPNGFSYRAFFEADPRIRHLLTSFVVVDRVGSFHVLIPARQQPS
ncbi:hypothetical protein [Sphaerobacter sp.]|uniref:hypothetical protein n=1 Tax=Sphaerobacter sp. TaxID=2099654 RepID=UPI001DB37E69|nr:hypothetical protein [Sphaerobacter sp.]MBX5446296.1 hypothetical protein [Sphaerobacter sp.]